MKFDFTYEQYEEILKQMKKINNVYCFSELTDQVKNGYILRHDVDFDLKKAYDLSKIEKKKDIVATYFVLTTSDIYNITSSENRKILKQMSDDGFEIGLHFDPLVYNFSDVQELQKMVELETKLIESITTKKVKSISLHNPSFHGLYPEFNKYINSYSTKYFNPNLYLSDSCKNFRGKNPFEFIKIGQDNLVQVLFHPIHFSQEDSNYINTFSQIIVEKVEKFDKSMIVNKTYMDEAMKLSLLDTIKGINKDGD